jgi:hypothetical protein
LEEDHLKMILRGSLGCRSCVRCPLRAVDGGDDDLDDGHGGGLLGGGDDSDGEVSVFYQAICASELVPPFQDILNLGNKNNTPHRAA